MQLNLLNLRNLVRFKTNYQNTTALANSTIVQQINIGYMKVIRAAVEADQDFFEEQKTKFNIVALSSLYSLPSDCIKVKQVRLAYTSPSSESDYRIAISYDPSEAVNISNDETSVPVSNPQVDITNNYLRIYPKPTTGVANGGEIYYIARPSALTLTGDVPILPDAVS